MFRWLKSKKVYQRTRLIKIFKPTHSKMKAVMCTSYGPPEVLQLKEVQTPVPGDNEVLVKIFAATVTMGDCEIRNLSLPLWTRIPVRLFMGYSKPRHLVPGMEFAGVVEAVGKEITKFKKGDQVFGSGGMGMGAYAEYISRPETYLSQKPANVTFEDAATLIVGGLNALHFLRKAEIQAGQKVLIIGAGGSIGTYGVLLAKFFGAEVTAVDRTDKLEMLRSIGADHVIDYTRDDFSHHALKYDVIFDVVYKSSFSKCVRSLKENGCYLMANTSPVNMLRGLLVSWRSSKKMVFEMAPDRGEGLDYLAGLISEGKIKPVIDRQYRLEQAAEAHAYVEKGFKKGNVILLVSVQYSSA